MPQLQARFAKCHTLGAMTDPRYRRMLNGMKDQGDTQWSVYMLRCADASLYTGIAKDVQARLAVHNAGRGGSYTRSHRPVELLYVEAGFSRAGALRREAAIKRLPRLQKDKLVLNSTKMSPIA